MKKSLIITLLVALSVMQSGCGVVRGVGMAVGSVCEGVGHIGTGIKEDMVAASDGHSDQYRKNEKK